MQPGFQHIVYAAPEELSSAHQTYELWPERGALPLPLVSASPLALAEMELLLQGPVVDLGAIAEVVKHDAGVTAQLLFLANRDREESDRFYRIEDCLVQVGISPLRELVRATPPLVSSDWRGRLLLNHSRLTALAAEAIARLVPGMNLEKVYLAGLLHLFPELIRSGMPGPWPLPAFVWEVIHGFKHPSMVSGEGHRLCEVVLSACEWAGEVELRPATKSPHRLIRS